MTSVTKVVVLGGGIGGVEAAIQARKLGFEVELVSDRDDLFIYPISIWIPVSTLPPEDAKLPLRALAQAHGFQVTLDRVVALDGASRSFTLERGGLRRAEHVILAMGASKVQAPGQEHTLSICGSPDQALELKARIDALVDRGAGSICFGFGGNPKDASAVRGGPAFELFFNLHHRLAKLGLRDRFELTFFAPMAQPGARMGEGALRMMASQFQRKGLRTKFGVKILGFEPDAVLFEDGTRLQSDLTMFIAAGNGHPVAASSDLPKNGAGFVHIEPTCQVVGLPTWFAIGDVAALEGPDWKAKQGHLAEAMARIAVHNLARALGRIGGALETYAGHLSITCLMDMGNGGGLVYRDDRRAMMIPMPILGHWLKRLWGHYYKGSKLGRLPRIPGL